MKFQDSFFGGRPNSMIVIHPPFQKHCAVLKQLYAGSTLGVYSFGLIFVSARTNKRHHHLSVHHLWGRTLAKHNPDACDVAYTDDGYTKAKLSVALEVLSDK
jgi:hypothetical protein